MVMPSQMLPPNATALERAIADTAPRQLLDVLADAPRRLKSEPQDVVVPWLLAEYGLADFSFYFDDPRALLEEGKAWTRARGTGAAVKQSLRWIGLDATLEEDGWRLQIDPANESAIDQIKAVLHLVGRSVPAHVQLYRLYHFYDHRHVVLDASRLDDGLLDDDSGVWQSGVKLSFGTRHAVTLPSASDGPKSGATQTASRTIHNDNSWRLDAWSLDSEILLDAASGLVNQVGYAIPTELPGLIVYTRHDGAAHIAALIAVAPNTGRTDTATATLADDRRTWRGRWSGTWREVIPSQLTNEVA